MEDKEQKNSQMIGEDLVEVDFAREFQEAIVSSKVLSFTDDALKNKILSANRDQLIVVTSSINSPKSVKSVDFYNEEFLLNSL